MPRYLEDDYKPIESVNNDSDDFYNRMMTTDMLTKVPNYFFNRKFSNEYKELFLFELITDFEEITFLDELSYNDSYSVGANPKIIQEPFLFRIQSMFDIPRHGTEFSNHFFPPMRDPPRKNFKL